MSETDKVYDIEEVEKIIETVDDGGDGVIEKDEFLELIWNELETNKPEEAFVELFKQFGATHSNDVITIGKF